MLKNRRKLLVKWEYSNVKITKKRNCYFFVINSPVYLPLKIKHKRLLSSRINVLTFEWIASEYLSCFAVALDATNSILIRDAAAPNQWQKLSIDISKYRNITEQNLLQHNGCIGLHIIPFPAAQSSTFRIRNIHLRSYNKDEEQKKYLINDWKKNVIPTDIDLCTYLHSQQFMCVINKVCVEKDEIYISGKRMMNLHGKFYLCEIPMFKDLSSCNLNILTELDDSDELFQIEIPRILTCGQQTYDRLYSRWILAVEINGKLVICSHARYADVVECTRKHDKLVASNKKGLGDFRYIKGLVADLNLLDISYITINIRINDFLQMTPQKESIPFSYMGRAYYADKTTIKQYDEILLSAAKKNIIVCAIILVYPEKRSKDKKVGRLLEYPEFDSSGFYSMPNMTSLESLNLYAAAIDFLADRYNQEDHKYGRIHNWIVHNEVDAGRVWTNAGDKTLIQFMDLYVKSLRLVYLTSRKYDSHAEVFISLSHFWRIASDEPNCYPGIDVLNILIDYSKAEGDFKWGVAYHPYPENLVEPKSWRDKHAAFDFQTEVITFKNLEVLDAWIKLPMVLYNGSEKRTLLLSEQNPNSIDYSCLHLKEQAASLAYVWKKVKMCKNIDAYIAHSWIDAKYERGLKTGIRKYLDDLNDPCGKKDSWYVYESAGTEREDEVFEFAKSIIGIDQWSEIIHPINVIFKSRNE